MTGTAVSDAEPAETEVGQPQRDDGIAAEFRFNTIAARAEAAADENHQRIVAELNLSPMLGITTCPSTPFVRWDGTHQRSTLRTNGGNGTFLYQPYRMPQHTEVNRLSYRINITNPQCARSPLGVQLCAFHRTAAAEMWMRRERRDGTKWTEVPSGTHAIEVVVDRAVMAQIGHTHLCVVVRCGGSCHPALKGPDAARYAPRDPGISVSGICDFWGGRNVLMAPLPVWKPPPPPPPRSSPTQPLAAQADFLILLVDSLDWLSYNDSFKKTAATIANVEREGQYRVAKMVESHSTGYLSAKNHVVFFTGSHVDRCLFYMRGHDGTAKRNETSAEWQRFERLQRRVSEPGGAPADPSVQRHFMRAFREIGYQTAMMYPVWHGTSELMCAGIGDENVLAAPLGHSTGFIDDFRWRFYGGVVPMVQKYVNGSQGCVGHRHELDYGDELIESFFSSDMDNVSGGGRIAFVGSQAAHQSNFAGDKLHYFDHRLALTIERFLEGGRDSPRPRTLLLMSDHGPGFQPVVKGERVLRAQYNPVYIWVTPKHADPFWSDVVGRRLGERQHLRFTHFDFYATMMDIVLASTSSAGYAAVVDPLATEHDPNLRHRLSLIRGDELHTAAIKQRDCDDMGIFLHQCQFTNLIPLFREGVDVAPQSLPTTELLQRLRHSVTRVFADVLLGGKQGAAKNAARPCVNLVHFIANHPGALDIEQVSARDFSKGACTIEGLLHIKGVNARDELGTPSLRSATFSFSTPVFFSPKSEGDDGQSCVKQLLQQRTLSLSRVARLTPYAPDERACGQEATKRGFDMSFCMCAV